MPWGWAWLPLACAQPASQFLSEEFFPGYHILEQVTGSRYRVYERSRVAFSCSGEHRGQSQASPPEVDLSQIQGPVQTCPSVSQKLPGGLYDLLRIAPREPLQLPCAFFNPQGQMLELRGRDRLGADLLEDLLEALNECLFMLILSYSLL